VPEDEKSRRNSILLEMQSGISRERNAALVTSSQEVLFEGRDGGLAQGRTRTNKIVLAPGGAGLVGRFASVRIEDVTCHTLRGTRV
jgi:tRNA A37 methylthiotransferase MiaB